MKMVNVHKAKTELSKLLAEIEAGEEIIIARHGKPVARMVPIQSPSKMVRVPGMLSHFTAIPDGFFFDPLPQEELNAWEGGQQSTDRS